MESLTGKKVVVAGGTGNVGSFIVRGLLESGAEVAVPSRSEAKINEFQEYLQKFEDLDPNKFYPFVGNISDESEAAKLLEQISGKMGTPDAAVATLGGFIPAPSLLTVDLKDLNQVLRDYLIAHFIVARTFLPVFQSQGGTFVFINGPLALNPWKGAGLVSISTAAQQMLFKALAKELEGSRARVAELMTYAYIRNRQTQPGSTVTGEGVGALASYLVSDAAKDIHGKSIHLKTMDKLEELGLELKK